MALTLYNRISGWIWLVLGSIGWNGGQIGDYLNLHPSMSKVYVVLGILAILGARSKQRYNAATVTVVLATVFTIIGVLGIILTHSFITPDTPLETLMRFLSALWGWYALVSSIQAWIHAQFLQV